MPACSHFLALALLEEYQGHLVYSACQILFCGGRVGPPWRRGAVDFSNRPLTIIGWEEKVSRFFPVVCVCVCLCVCVCVSFKHGGFKVHREGSSVVGHVAEQSGSCLRYKGISSADIQPSSAALLLNSPFTLFSTLL